MATFKSFEEIEVWQKSRILARKIFELYNEGGFSKDYRLKDQINGASGSVMDNIAEGFERNGSREFIQFLAIAKGSVGEVRSQLYRALDRAYISESSFLELKDETLSISKQISGLINYLRQSDLKGSKFVRKPNPEP